MKSFQKIDVLIDNQLSWIWQYGSQILTTLAHFADAHTIYRTFQEIEEGDIMFLLSCDRILPVHLLKRHKHNIVIHESDVPLGKGWSPLSWQVENGCNNIPVTLFEAEKELDSGGWYIKDYIQLSGVELIERIRKKQMEKTLELMRRFLDEYPMPRKPQTGEETFFVKRTTANQELDVNKSIASQFNKLRVCDNERYPAHFSLNGKKYILKIYEES